MEKSKNEWWKNYTAKSCRKILFAFSVKSKAEQKVEKSRGGVDWRIYFWACLCPLLIAMKKSEIPFFFTFFTFTDQMHKVLFMKRIPYSALVVCSMWRRCSGTSTNSMCHFNWNVSMLLHFVTEFTRFQMICCHKRRCVCVMCMYLISVRSFSESHRI